jgi:hypothetical protein
VQYQHHYHGKRLGLFKFEHQKMDMVIWDYYEENSLMQYVSTMWIPETQQLHIYQMKDNMYHGFMFALCLLSHSVLLQLYERGETKKKEIVAKQSESSAQETQKQSMAARKRKNEEKKLKPSSNNQIVATEQDPNIK